MIIGCRDSAFFVAIIWHCRSTLKGGVNRVQMVNNRNMLDTITTSLDHANLEHSLSRREVCFLLFILSLISMLPSCTSSGRQTVTARADAVESSISTSDCWISVPTAERFVRGIAETLRKGLIKSDSPYEQEGWERTLKNWNVYDRFDVYIVNSPTSNASTIGENFAMVHTRLFLELPKPDFLAAVLAHEYGHIAEGHAVEENVRYQTATSIALAAAMMGAAAEGYSNAYSTSSGYGYQRSTQTTDWGQWFQNVMHLYSPFRKKDEIEADRRGLEIFVAAGYNPKDYLDTFKWMLRKHGDKKGKSHPRMSMRVKVLEQDFAKSSFSSTGINLNDAAFEVAKEAVRREILKRGASGQFQTFENMATTISAQVLRVYSCGIDGDLKREVQQYFDLLKK